MADIYTKKLNYYAKELKREPPNNGIIWIADFFMKWNQVACILLFTVGIRIMEKSGTEMVKNSPIAKWSGIQAVVWIADKIVWYSDHQMNSGQLPGIWILDDLVSAIQMPGKKSGIQLASE